MKYLRWIPFSLCIAGLLAILGVYQGWDAVIHVIAMAIGLVVFFWAVFIALGTI